MSLLFQHEIETILISKPFVGRKVFLNSEILLCGVFCISHKENLISEITNGENALKESDEIKIHFNKY